MSLIPHYGLFEQAEFWDKVTSQGNNPASTSTISWVNAETAARPAGVCTEYCKLADKSRFMWSVIPQQWSCRSQLQFADISFFLWTVFWSVDRLIALRLGMETRISCFAREDENEHLMTNGRLFFLQQAEYCLSIRQRRRRFWTWFFLSLVSLSPWMRCCFSLFSPLNWFSTISCPIPFTFQLIHSSAVSQWEINVE